MGLGLVDLVAPGVGRPVLEALRLVSSAASEMHESSELCVRVHEQLVFLHDKLAAMERKQTLPSDAILTKYARLVGEYSAFLDKHRRRIWVYRIVLYKHMLTKVREFQQDIAALMLALSMCHIDASADERAAMAAFRQQQVQFLAQQQRAIAARLTDDATVAKEVAHETQQVEALNVFRYELQQTQLGASPDDTEALEALRSSRSGTDDALAGVDHGDASASVRVLQTALDKVMRRSSVRVASVPEWFLPPHKVEFDPQAFARGSFGTVHYGTMGFADVVVKCLLVDTRGNDGVTSKFRLEAALWYKFRHRHVLTMYGACDVSSPPFIVCERAAHGNLFNFLSRARHRPLTFRLLRDAASGLAYLHEQRVVHGDLKCDNILVTDGETAKVADFSFSYVRTLSASKRSVAADPASASSAGALRWRAPECLKGRRPTFASDVFSFGMCILEAVSQELPWGYHVDDGAVWHLVTSGELPERPHGMSDRAWTLVERMCSFKPTDRPRLESVVAELSALAREHVSEDADASSSDASDNQLSHEGGLSRTASHLRRESKASVVEPVDNQRSASESSRVDASDGNQEPEAVAPRTSTSNASAEAPSAKTEQQLRTRSDLGACKSSVSAPVSVATLEQAIAADDADRAASFLASAASLDDPVDREWNAPPLIVAAATGATTVAQLLLLRGANAHAVTTAPSARLGSLDDASCSALHVAARFGHVRVVDALLTVKRDLLHTLTTKKRTAMYFAARFGHAAVVTELLRHGADAGECERESGKAPLAIAAQFGQVECVRVLLKSRAVDVHARDRSGVGAIHCAAASGYTDAVAVLLQHGADVNARDAKGSTPLHWAAVHGMVACVRTLLEHGADVHATTQNGFSALHVSAGKGHIDVIEALLRCGARVDAPDNDRRTPLYWAAEFGQVASTRVLLQYSADTALTTSMGSTAAHEAAANGHVDVLMALLTDGARTDAADRRGDAPLHWAARAGQLACTRALLEFKADVRATNRRGATALHAAASHGYADVLTELLQSSKSRVNERDREGKTALYCAAESGHLACVCALLEHSAHTEAASTGGATPLLVAAANGHREVLEALLKHSARVNASDHTGKTPLHWCAAHGQTACARALLEHNADTSARSSSGDTPLHLAAANEHADAIAALVKSGAQIDERNSTNGRTPLHEATVRGKLHGVKLLLAHSASVDVRDSRGETPLRAAASRGQLDLVHVLLEAGAAVDRADIHDAKREKHWDVVAMLKLYAPSVLSRLFR